MKMFIAGVVSTLLFFVLVGALVAWSVDVSAVDAPAFLQSPLGMVSTHSIRRHASDEKNPFAGDPAAAAKGLGHFQDNCLPCHGAAPVKANDFAEGLHPPAPDLASKKIQAFSDAELHWIIMRGVMMTGMPGFSMSHDKDDTWQIVSFLRRLPALSPDEIATLEKAAMKGMGHGGGAGMAKGGHDEGGMGGMAKGGHDSMKTTAPQHDMAAMGGKGGSEPANDEKIEKVEKVASATGRMAQSPLGDHVAVLEVTEEYVLVKVTRKDGSAPDAISDPILTFDSGGKTRTIQLGGKNGNYRAKADLGAGDVEVTLRATLSGKPVSTRLSLQRP